MGSYGSYQLWMQERNKTQLAEKLIDKLIQLWKKQSTRNWSIRSSKWHIWKTSTRINQEPIYRRDYNRSIMHMKAGAKMLSSRSLSSVVVCRLSRLLVASSQLVQIVNLASLVRHNLEIATLMLLEKTNYTRLRIKICHRSYIMPLLFVALSLVVCYRLRRSKRRISRV